MRVALIAIATGPYTGLVSDFLEGAARFFAPTTDIVPVILTDTTISFCDRQRYVEHLPWPGPTLRRYHRFIEHADAFSDCRYAFYCDVDMRFNAPVGPEILSPLTATLHPGFVNHPGTYETRPASRAYIHPSEGERYYCGAFNGGERQPFLEMAQSIAEMIDDDAAHGICAIWNDESYLNRYLIDHPPALVLSPSYCYPDDQPDYYRSRWGCDYAPRIIALSQANLKAGR